MYTLDPQIDKLILKWANNPDGTWKEVISDLVAFKAEIQKTTDTSNFIEYLDDSESTEEEYFAA